MVDIKTAQPGSHANRPRRSISQIVVLHIPHSSRRVPAEERQAILVDNTELNGELLRMTDAYTDELFPITPVEAGRVIFPLSRLVCDVERFPSDENEPMAARGMGVTYTRTSMGGVLRAQPDPADRQKCLDRWYWPHHSKLEHLVKDVAERSGVCLIVDCHSFPSVALPYELDQASPRADICIGTDSFHTPWAVRDAIVAAAEADGYSVAVDAPFSGALVPLSSYRKDHRILSVMIEVNRRLYMEEDSGKKKQGLGKVCATLGRLVMAAAEAAAEEASALAKPTG
jgi:N-formylglutamate deformylase